MTAWDLQWNDLTGEQKDHLMKSAEFHACGCCGNSGQIALDMFNAAVDVIKMRDLAEIQATLSAPATQDIPAQIGDE